MREALPSAQTLERLDGGLSPAVRAGEGDSHSEAVDGSRIGLAVVTADRAGPIGFGIFAACFVPVLNCVVVHRSSVGGSVAIIAGNISLTRDGHSRIHALLGILLLDADVATRALR